MSKEIYISSTPHETRLAIVEKDELSEIYYERENEYTLAGSIYNGRVTRVLPGMQSAFVDVGLERDAFLYITDFMEEQGDAADFESGGEARRGNDRGERGDRADRPGERKRGDRDRRPAGDSRDASPDSGEQGLRQESAPAFRAAEPDGVDDGFEGVSNTANASSVSNASGASTSSVESAEEDAEGSRRWRGRRGRRRGRSGETRPAAAGGRETPERRAADASPAPEETELEIDLEIAEPAMLDEVFGEAEGVKTQPEPSSYSSRPREDRGREDRGREERGRGRDRGGRGRDREHSGERGRPQEAVSGNDTAQEPAAEPFILPGESISKYRRGAEGAEGAEAQVAVSVRPQQNLVLARPSTAIDLSLAGWDGGTTLPGESLSRQRGRPETRPANQDQRPANQGQGSQSLAKPAPQTQPQGSTHEPERQDLGADEEPGGRNRRRDRDRRSGRGGREQEQPRSREREATPTEFHSGVTSREVLEPMDAVQPGVTSQHEPEDLDLPLGNAVFDLNAAAPSQEGEQGQEEAETLPVDIFYEASTDVVTSFSEEPGESLLEAAEELHETVAAAAEAAPVSTTEEFHEETLEYEPEEEASASYRVDPAGPSEFRQSGLIEDDLSSAPVRFDEGSEVAQAGATHEFTAIQPGGEMLSELPGEVAVPGAEEDPTNPIEHETAVHSAHPEVQGSPAITPPAEAGAPETAGEFESPLMHAGQSAIPDAPQAFAPGDGELEEELLDEDETDLVDMSAGYGDDTEEETLEAGAEIGSMARDRALEQITRTELTLTTDDEEDDEFDIDEEEMEEDELAGSEQIAGGEYADDDEEEDDRLEVGDTPFEEEGDKPSAALMGEFPEFAEAAAGREPGREGSDDRGDGRGEGRREPRTREGGGRGGRDRGGRSGRDSRGMANARSNGRDGGRPSRHSMQNTDLPAISDLLKPGQEVLVQIAKEPIAKKGARITSHIALPGRFLVFMPTVHHVGVSRKIESDGERRRLKEILLSEKGEAAGGFIVRTAASGATEEELRSDLRFLLNLWADIKQRSESSKSPALIYHDLNLVERILRDQVTDNFSAIWCDTETEYERVLRFLQRFQPSLMRRVKLYTKDTPLFEQFGISEEINKALRSKVWLKSGGSIVINQTEALVAIDINTGKFVGKTARLEDTIVKTNLDAIPEIVRQIRLRDLGGIIVIDFIDMDDRKNRHKVLAALEEELKNDRAPSKVLQFNDFGLVAITRKRVKQSLERTLSTTCAICAGTGMTKSPITVCNEIYTELRKMHKQLDKGDVMLRVNPEVVKQLKSGNGKWLQEMEEIAGKTILIKSDPSLHPEQFDIH